MPRKPKKKGVDGMNFVNNIECFRKINKLEYFGNSN